MENRIFCWWLNDSEMSDNRKNSLDSMRENSESDVIFITKETLKNYILPNFPLHEGYQYLSEIQKGDYLKCYFMHHYGGGYSDIKKIDYSWKNYFDRFKNNPNLYAVGYQERESGHIARLENCSLDPQKSKYCLDYSTNESKTEWSSVFLKQNYNVLIGNGNYICRGNTPFTQDWWNGLNEKMDGYLPLLKENPSKWPREAKGHTNPITGEISNYPIKWAVLNGNIFHPLTYKYRNNIERDFYYPNMGNYQ